MPHIIIYMFCLELCCDINEYLMMLLLFVCEEELGCPPDSAAILQYLLYF